MLDGGGGGGGCFSCGCGAGFRSVIVALTAPDLVLTTLQIPTDYKFECTVLDL